MLLVRAIFFAIVGVASLAIWLSVTISTTVPDFNRVREFTKTNCTVVKKAVERDGEKYRGALEVKLYYDKKNVSAVAYADYDGTYASGRPDWFLDRYELISEDINVDYDCFWKKGDFNAVVHSCKLLANDTASIPMCSLYDATGTCYRLEGTPATERTCYSLKSGANATMRLTIHGSFLAVPFFIIFFVVSIIGLVLSIKLDTRTMSKPWKFRGITI